MTPPGQPQCCDVVELRRYTLHPGARETLVDLFEEHLVEPQEELGMHVVGQFRDEAAPDAFVWLRGFRSMAERRRGLEGFYGGPVWRRHRDAANATMIDSDDVHLLEPLHRGPGWPAMGDPRAPSAAVFELTTVPLDAGGADRPDREAQAVLAALGRPPVAAFATLPAVNDFPALPVRPDRVLAWLLRFDDDATYAEHLRAAGAARAPGAAVHVLRPTGRSQLS